MLGLKLNHVSKTGPCYRRSMLPGYSYKWLCVPHNDDAAKETVLRWVNTYVNVRPELTLWKMICANVYLNKWWIIALARVDL